MTEPIELHTLAGAYALDALTEIERAGFARHMAECAACATEAAELTETAARMGAATALTPPPGLRGAVLAEISRTRQVPRHPAGPCHPGRRRRPLAQPQPDRRGRRRPGRGRPRYRVDGRGAPARDGP